MILSGVQVVAPPEARAVVVFGDSITDGNRATIDANTRWTDYLAKRLTGKNISVLNAGISGGGLISDVMGVNALSRFDRGVLSQPQIKTVIVSLGINDIGWSGTVFDAHSPAASPDRMIAGYRQLLARAHARKQNGYKGQCYSS